MRKIEARKKDRERKTQDLQKLITAADSGISATTTAADHSPATHRGTPPDKKQQVRKKNTPFATPKAKLELLVMENFTVPSDLFRILTFSLLIFFCVYCEQPTVETPNTGIKFPEFKASGVFLRSQRMKLPPSVGQKKSKAIEQMLTELGLGTFIFVL